MNESGIQKKITDWLTTQKIFWQKNHQTAYSRAGIPDLTVCVNGMFLALEVKTPSGKPSPSQLLELRKISQSGGRSEIVRSLDEVRKIVAEMQNAQQRTHPDGNPQHHREEKV